MNKKIILLSIFAIFLMLMMPMFSNIQAEPIDSKMNKNNTYRPILCGIYCFAKNINSNSDVINGGIFEYITIFIGLTIGIPILIIDNILPDFIFDTYKCDCDLCP